MNLLGTSSVIYSQIITPTTSDSNRRRVRGKESEFQLSLPVTHILAPAIDTDVSYLKKYNTPIAKAKLSV